MDHYIMLTVFLVIILLFTIGNMCFLSVKEYCHTINVNIENNEFKKVCIEILSFYYFGDTINLKI